jgi:flagellar hook-associated protein 2
MAGTVTFSGVGSGIDVESLISGLTAVEAQPINTEKSKAASFRAAQSTFSDIGGLLSKLKLSVAALNSPQNASSFSATATGTALAVSASGSAQPGSYDVTVQHLAKEQRTYSNAQGNGALGLSGNLDLAVGTGDAVPIQIDATDTVNNIADKINGSGLRVSASVFYDGSQYRLQVRGLDTGDPNKVTFGAPGGVGDQLGFNDPLNTKQAAQSASLLVDGFQVKSDTNAVNGAIPGVTLALKEESTSKVTVDTDPAGLGDKLQAVVTAYNAVVNSIHTASGSTASPASNPALAGNSSLRTVATRLSSSLLNSFGGGKFSSLGSVGVNLQNDGTLVLDRTKLGAALSGDRAGVTALIGGTQANGVTTKGVMAAISDVIDDVTDPAHGALLVARDSFDARAKRMEDHIASSQTRLQAYSDQLRKQFTAMDTEVAGYQSQLSALSIKA